MTLTRAERRWAACMLSACVPAHGDVPGLEDVVDLGSFVDEAWRRYPLHVLWGLRLLFFVIQFLKTRIRHINFTPHFK